MDAVEIFDTTLRDGLQVEGVSASVDDKLRILAAISHDLQTPITRMRLRAESIDEGVERDRILEDLREMEHLVREGVAYARSAHGGDEVPVRIDPAAFIESLVEEIVIGPGVRGLNKFDPSRVKIKYRA